MSRHYLPSCYLPDRKLGNTVMFSGGIVDFWRVPNRSGSGIYPNIIYRRLFDLYARSLRKIRLHILNRLAEKSHFTARPSAALSPRQHRQGNLSRFGLKKYQKHQLFRIGQMSWVLRDFRDMLMWFWFKTCLFKARLQGKINQVD